MKSVTIKTALAICAAMFLAACSSGGDGGGGTPPVATPLSGVFVDSAVSGLGYNAAPSGLSGLTDATGRFNYRPGDMMTFNICSRVIGQSVPGSPEVTALSVFGATSTTDPRVVNLSQLLLTVGGVPTGQNPIQLPVPCTAPLPVTLNFDDQNFDTVIQAALQPAGLTLVNDAQAIAHLQAQFSTVSVVLAGAGSGTVTSAPSGLNCSSGMCSAVFTKNTSVTLTSTGAGFFGWSGGTGNASGCTTGACTFTVSQDSSITATFNPPPPQTLTTLIVGNGGVTCSTDNEGTFNTCAPQYNAGTSLVLKATAQAGSSFQNWTGGTGNATVCNNSSGVCRLMLNATSEVTANFVLNTVILPFSALPVSVNGGVGVVECSTTGAQGLFAPCALSYNAGTQLTLQATSINANFTGWGSGTGSAAACNGSANPLCSFQLTQSSTVIANFNRPTLSVLLSGTGSVSSNLAGITCNPTCSAVFNKGAVVTLTATGDGFTGWSGGCSGTGLCQVTLSADTIVTASFNQVSSVSNFKFIAAAGQKLLAINPASPGTPIPVKVGGVDVTFPIGAGRDGAGSYIASASYSAGTTSFTNIRENTIFFHSGGKFYRASTLVSSGVPGVGGNEPVQVSSFSGTTTTSICGAGSLFDPANPNPIVGFSNAGSDTTCNTPDDVIMLMHLNDSSTTAPVPLLPGVDLNGESNAVFDTTNGRVFQVIVSTAAGDLQWMDNTLSPASIAGGAGIGQFGVVAQETNKVFLRSTTKLYIYTPSSKTLSAPVVTADAGQTWVQGNTSKLRSPADTTAIFLVQTNGHVFRVPLTTTADQTITTKHFIPAVVTLAARVTQTPNKIIIQTGIDPNSNNNGQQSPCAIANNCNNGILAVDKTFPNTSVEIEPALLNKQIYSFLTFNNYVLYGVDVPNVPGGDFVRIDDATALRINVSNGGGWSGVILADSINLATRQQSTIRALLVRNTSQLANGAIVQAFNSPTDLSPVTLGTVSDPSGLLQGNPFFHRSVNAALIGFANLVGSTPTNQLRQPFFVDTTVPNSLTKITPLPQANWYDVGF